METNRRTYEQLPEYDLSGSRTLIVDAHAGFTEILSELLSDYGVECVVARTREAALAAIRSGVPFDAVALGGDSDLAGGTADLPGAVLRHHGDALVVCMAGCPVERHELVRAGAGVVTDKADCYRAVVAGLVARRKASGLHVAVRN